MSLRKIDCLSEGCPIPLLRAIKELKTMEKGDILIITSDHSCVGINIEEWAQNKGYPIELLETEGGNWEVYIEKTK